MVDFAWPVMVATSRESGAVELRRRVVYCGSPQLVGVTAFAISDSDGSDDLSAN